MSDPRLDRLERTVQHQRWALFGLVALILLVGFRNAPPESIDVRNVTIRDEDNNVVAYMGACDGGSEIVLYGDDFTGGVHIEANKYGGAMQIKSLEHADLITMGAGQDGGVVDFRNKKGDPVLSMGGEEAGGFANFMNQSGANNVEVDTGPFGGSIIIRQKAGRHGLSLYTLDDGGHFAVMDEKGDTVHQVP